MPAAPLVTETTKKTTLVQSPKLLEFSKCIGRPYDIVKRAWAACKMDGFVIPQEGSSAASHNKKRKEPPGASESHISTTIKAAASTTNALTQSSRGQLAGQKRNQDSFLVQNFSIASISAKRHKLDEDDGQDESEYDTENDSDSEDEDDEQRKRARKAEQHRKRIAKQDLIKLKLSPGSERRDVEWALNAILQFASIAPGEPIAILRNIIRTLPNDGNIHDHGGQIVDMPANLQQLKDAGDLWLNDPNQDPTQAFLRAFNIAVVYREVTRRCHRKGNEDIEERANELLKLRNLKHAHNLGIKVLTLAFAISHRNMIGVLLLPHFGLDVSGLQDLSEGKMVALIGLLTSNHWSLEQMGIAEKHAGVVEYITMRLIPGIEASLLANLSNRMELPTVLKDMVHYDPTSKENWRFGLKIKKTMIRRHNRDESIPEAVVYMPPLYMIDSLFKTSDENKFDREYIISLCHNRVHLDREIMADKVDEPKKVTQEIFEGWIQYTKFWKIRGPAVRLPPFDVSSPKCSKIDDINEQEWKGQNPYITFWGTLLCKCPKHVKANRFNINSSILGSLAPEEIRAHKCHDSQIKAQFNIRDIMKEASPEPGNAI